ncbi:filamentous hemagglutinin family protein [Rhodoplanes sp. TEM]|uniref:filamentous haemagglutinin family protein n=1 Tax=Rhodoplanes sp. TEM TaxID=3025489 RepID=UPI002350B45A|nr:filamentous haemagglutinin family protein [Rhodoplanes sp. TEM]MDC7986977.1 filamentous hemagglutinin family protein [Rhodoplanes sp. TEM]
MVAPGAVPSATDGGVGLWQGANLPTQTTTSGGRTQVEVKQTESKAILTWESFNVGRETDLYFNQTAGGSNVANWIALNRVLDPTAAPSKILGTIKAEGQVYVINRNGIIFGGSSQVNVHTLVASSLSLSNAQFMAGIGTTLVAKADFVLGGADTVALPTFGEHGSLLDYWQSAAAQSKPAFVPGNPPGDVRVESGAVIETAAGGKAMLFAPHVINAGTVRAIDGQVILAAGEQVSLYPSLDVRGFDVAVSAPMPWLFSRNWVTQVLLGEPSDWQYAFQTDLVNSILPGMDQRAADVGYSVANTGIVSSLRGDITFQGRDIAQSGLIYANTALNNQGGSVRLQAWSQGSLAYSTDGDPSASSWRAGTLTLSEGSIILVEPDLGDTSTIELSSLSTRYEPGRVELRGYEITVESNAGVVVPAGSISVVASAQPTAPDEPNGVNGGVADGSLITIAENAYLSTAGLIGVTLSMESNVVAVELRIAELADSALYRDSWLRGETIYVDRRESGIFTDGVMAGVEWIEGETGKWVGTPLANVSAWLGTSTTTLGELSTVGGSIVLKSGGSVITRAGSVLDVAGGSITYTGGWVNTTKLVGADGRIYDIADATPDRVYVGFAGDTTVDHAHWRITEVYSSRLRRAESRYEAGYTEGRAAGAIQIWAGEAIVLEGGYAGGTVVGERQAAKGTTAAAGTLTIGDASNSNRMWLPDNVVISNSPLLLAEDLSNLREFYDSATQTTTLRLDSDLLAASQLGTIELNLRTGFELTEGTRLELDSGAAFTANANSGAATDVHYTVNGSIRIAGGSVHLIGDIDNIKIGSKASIDVSGQWINEVSDRFITLNRRVDGGSVRVEAGMFDVAAGARIDVSGGGFIAVHNGEIGATAGDGGSITLRGIDGESLGNLDLSAYAAGAGGSLELTTPAQVQLGGGTPSDAAVMHIGDALYSDRGFRLLSIETTQGIEVPEGAHLSQVPVSIDLLGSNYFSVASGSHILDVASPTVLPLWRRAGMPGTSVDLTAGQSVVFGHEASLVTDVLGSVGIGGANIRLSGTIEAPAGNIHLFSPAGEIVLGDGAALLARGVPIIYAGQGQRRIGDVLDGGTVVLDAPGVEIGAGSLIDVSGASGVIDVGGRVAEAVTLGSDGGFLSITANFFDLTEDADHIVRADGGVGATNGRFSFSAGKSGTDGTTLSAHVGASGVGSFYGTTTPGGPTASLGNVYLTNLFANASAEDLAAAATAYDANPTAYGGAAGATFAAARLTSGLLNPFRTLLVNSAKTMTLSVGEGGTGGSASLGITDPVFKLLLGIMTGDLVPKNNSSLNVTIVNKVNLAAINPTTGTYNYMNRAAFDTRLLEHAGFSSISLQTNGGAINFGSGASLPAADLITLNASIIGTAASGATKLSAGYVRLIGAGSATPQQSGSAVLDIDASVIAIKGSIGFAGYDVVNLTASSDLQLEGGYNGAGASIYAPGDIIMTAAQIYPLTQASQSIQAGRTIIVNKALDGTGAPIRAPLPLSVAGSLTLEAPMIAQNGTLVAPFGAITLTADDLTLGAGSVTSVSGAGLTALYGTLLNGEQWQVDSGSGTATTITGLPEKTITLNGSTVGVSSGAMVDISGGGDLLAWEFVAGTGGSHDVLAMSGMYAILPSQASAATSSGQRIWLDGGNGLVAGWYTLLPARYALLPGAYAIQLVDGSAGKAIAKSVTLADGTVLMSGKLGNVYTGTSDVLSSTVRIMSGEVVRSYSDYNEATANTYFASDAFKTTIYRLTGVRVATPRLPMDGGSVVFNASRTLVLDGSLEAQGERDGLSGLVDITGSKIAIVGTGVATGDLSGYLLLDADSLTAFGGSLLIGGTRTEGTDGLHLTVTASDIVVRNDAGSELSAPEAVLAATGSIIVADGSVVTAAGSTESSAILIVDPQSGTQDFGSLIRVSSGGAVMVTRTNADSSVAAGTITIGAGAVLRGRSVLIDATNAAGVTMAASASLIADNLSLASGRIGFGGGSGLVLDQASLTQLATAQNLTLRSYTTFDFYTGLDLTGLTAVTLDGAGLVGYGDHAIAITGNTITLANTGSDFAEPTGTGSGSLAIGADELILGAGAKALRGFATVTLTGANGIVGEGKGSLDAGAAAVTLATPVLTGRNAANQAVTTTGALSLVSTGGNTTLSAADSLGSIVSLTGGNVLVAGTIVAQGGAANVAATGGALTLADGTVIDVGAVSKTFYDVAEYGDAGTIALTAIGGDLLLASGATLNLAGGTDGGAAGTLSLTSSGGNVSLLGTIDAHAAAGEAGGTFALDTLTLTSFSGLNRALDSAGFTASRQFRIREGDVTLDGATVAEEFVLVADAGSVTITGSVDARATYGGTISISAGNGLVMTSSTVLVAGATDTTDGIGSGRVTLEASGGSLDIRGGTIDVSGGDGGKVRFRAVQTATHDGVAVEDLIVAIVGSRSSMLEGVAVYDASATGTVEQVWSAAVGDAGTFMAAAPAIAATISPGIAVMAGIDIRSSGDLTLGSNIDLYNTFISAREGGLTLRAGGNLNINGSISDGFSTATTTGTLLNTKSWDLRLVAGADLQSASAVALQRTEALPASKGSLIVGDATHGYLIRTGSGDIDIAAGRDIRLTDYAAAIYTAGRADTTVYSDFTPKVGAVYGIEGGNLSVAAGGSIAVDIASTENLSFVNWLSRTGTMNATTGLFSTAAGGQSSWWVNYGGFRQGVGALGGGNVAVKAGGDIGNLVVALATTGRVHGGTVTPDSKILETDNGGALTVSAGGAIRGGQYYVGRGSADIRANELGVGTGSGGTANTFGLAPLLALDDATINVTTSANMVVQTVADPLLANASFGAYMSGYTVDTAIDLLSIGGDIVLVNPNSRSNATRHTDRYPAKTRITALNGSVENRGYISMMPSSSTELRILAAENVVTGAIVMGRALTTAMPSPFKPFATIHSNNATNDPDWLLLNDLTRSAYAIYGGGNPDVLELADDYEPSRIYALAGSIDFKSLLAVEANFSGVATSEQTWFRAGTDIRNLNFHLRNIHATDVSLLEAGNDIIGPAILPTVYGNEIQGPGSLLLSAGREIYAPVLPIYSTGNRAFDYTTNTPILNSEIKGLPARGASVTLMAGINAAVGYDAFAAAYLDPTNVSSMASWLTTTVNGVVVPLYLTDAYETSVGGATHRSRQGLVSFVEEVTGETLSPLDAWARFQTLPALTRQQFIRSVYFQELRAAGRDQTGGLASGGYNRGYTAIETLFPGDSWSGDVKFDNALVRTMAGGDIHVLTPGGGFQVAALNQAVESGYGLVTLGYGHINVFAQDDIVVNQSRVLTFSGGGIVMWSTEGDIDAGRGAKTQRVPSAPVVDTDADGVTRVTERADISGSGIGTIEGYTGVEPGDVDLIAPQGTVNAGDAGIRVSGDFTVAARFVLNMDNIKVSGETKGVPKEDTKVAPLTVETKDKTAAEAAAAATQQATGDRPSVIIVEILGYGGGDGQMRSPEEGDLDERRRDRRSGPAPVYDPAGPVQIIGVGPLTEEERLRLRAEERGRL